ncbi:MAG: cyclic pyranopterin monophosphate synthase MoaC [Polyangiaceae bacterium]
MNAAGEVHMVDVADKPETRRRAVACGSVHMSPAVAERISRNDAPKGEVLATARVAGIMAAKRTHELIPLCHPIALTSVEVTIDVDARIGRVDVRATAEATYRTGVEMEALTAASIACLTIYDMVKGLDREMVIGEVKLLEKSGGRGGTYVRDGA